MDAINKTRMPFKPQYIYSAGAVLVVAIAAVLLVLFLNSDDDAVGESVPAAISARALVTLTGVFTVESGSDEAEIVALLERGIFNLRIRDAEAFQAVCHPDQQASVPVAQIATFIEEDSSNPGYLQPVFTPEMNFIIHDIRRFRDTATVIYDWREGVSVIRGIGAQEVEKVDGAWYIAQPNVLCVGNR